MASNINPTNINGAYPIAGQDNDSQGFRDNFTNIRTNLTHTKTELEDLQSKAILKSPLTGGDPVDNSFNGVLLTGAQTQGFTEAFRDLGMPNANTVTFNFTQGDYQKVTVNAGLAGGFDFDFADWPDAGVYATIRVLFTPPVADTNPLSDLNFPASVTSGTNSLVGYDSVTRTLTSTINGSYFFEFGTIDGGANVSVTVLNTPEVAASTVRNTVNNNLNGHVLTNFAQQAATYTPTAPAVEIDVSVADLHRITTGQNVVLSFTRWPAAGYASTRVWITVTNTLHTITLPSAVSVGVSKLPPLGGVGYIAGEYLFEFSSMDAGATVLVVPLITP